MARQPQILLIDDDAAITADLVPLLRQSNYTVATLAHADAALAYLSGHPVDLIVSDQQMPPGITGAELLCRLRAQGNPIPFILMSSRPIDSAAQPSADAYLKKPFSIDDLLAQIKTVLSTPADPATSAQNRAIIAPSVAKKRLEADSRGEMMKKSFIWAIPLILSLLIVVILQFAPTLLPDAAHLTIDANYLILAVGIAFSLVLLGAVRFYRQRERRWEEDQRRIEATLEQRATQRASQSEAALQQRITDLDNQLSTLQVREEQARRDAEHQTIKFSDESSEVARQIEQKAVKARHDFYKRLDHEVKQPLQRLQSAADNLYRAAGGAQGETAAYYRRLVNEIKQVDSLVGDLRKLAEIASDNQPFEPERIHPGELLSEVVGDAKANDPRATTRDIQLRLPDFPELPPPDILGEPYNLTRVFRNLLDNAIKYTDENGVIRIRAYASPDREHVVVEVIDNGRGIPQQELDQVWEELYRASNAGADGRGLGLALVRIVVERHGGERFIHQLEPPQHGTKVTLTFPAISAAASREQPHLAPAAISRPAPLEEAVGDTPRSR